MVLELFHLLGNRPLADVIVLGGLLETTQAYDLQEQAHLIDVHLASSFIPELYTSGGEQVNPAPFGITYAKL